MKPKMKYSIALIYFSLMLFPALVFNSCGREVSVTPPDAPPPDGYIYINSNPKGFQIYLNGKEQRRLTPDSLQWLSTGTYQITLKKDLYKDSTFYVYAVEGKREFVFIDYSGNSSMFGSIFCDSSPENAEIFINDSSSGHFTPYTFTDILPGDYEIRFHLNNFKDDSINVSVSSGSTNNASMYLLDTLLWQQYTTSNSSIKTNNLTSIGIDKNDIIWVGTQDLGVLSFDGNIWGGSQVYPSLPAKNINCITVDNNNVMLFGTNNGFVAYDGSLAYMYGFKSSGLPNYFIEAICTDDSGNWYIGTQGGVTKTFNSNGVRNWSNYPANMIPDNNISCLLSDLKGNLWVGTNDNGMSIIKSNGDWQVVNNSNSNIINNNIKAIAESPAGIIWIGFSSNSIYGGGLSYYDGSSWHNVGFIPFSSQTNAIYIDKNDTKWIGTDQGLVKVTAGNAVTTFNKANTGMDINDVTGVAQDSKGNIWISTYSGGLVEYKGSRF